MSSSAIVTKTTTITGHSDAGIEDAIKAALERAEMTLQDVLAFEVRKIDGVASADGDWTFRVQIDVTFVVKEKFLHE